MRVLPFGHVTASVVGAGWLGTALAARVGGAAIPRRQFRLDAIVRQSVVFIASGRSAVSRSEDLPTVLAHELGHLRAVLDACEGADVCRVVVLGSSDVAGLDVRVTGDTTPSPVTPYARVKAALEDECRLRASGGMAVTSVRLAPVHGPGKRRTDALVRLARSPVVPLPGGGRQSMGFVLLDDALRAIQWLSENPAPAVVAVGGGPTPLRDLLTHLATAQGARPHFVPLPAPAAALRKVGSLVTLPDSLHWLLRLALPREVVMEVPVPVTPLAQAAAMLVASC